MIRSVLVLNALILSGTAAFAQSSAVLLAPADPQHVGSGPRYQSVTAGLKRYKVVDPKDWIALNKAVGPQGSAGGSHDGSERSKGRKP